MSEEILFREIKQGVIAWIKNQEDVLKERGVHLEEMANQESGYRIGLDFLNCIAEITVNQPEFAPYRFSSIQILSLKEELNEPIYVWYDKEGDDLTVIYNKLNDTIDFALNY